MLKMEFNFKNKFKKVCRAFLLFMNTYLNCCYQPTNDEINCLNDILTSCRRKGNSPLEIDKISEDYQKLVERSLPVDDFQRSLKDSTCDKNSWNDAIWFNNCTDLVKANPTKIPDPQEQPQKQENSVQQNQESDYETYHECMIKSNESHLTNWRQKSLQISNLTIHDSDNDFTSTKDFVSSTKLYDDDEDSDDNCQSYKSYNNNNSPNCKETALQSKARLNIKMGYRNPKIRVPQISNCVLVGDDYFLELARKNLKSGYYIQKGICGKGFCMSGMTLNLASKKLANCRLPTNTNLIINVGSVDILNCISLKEMVKSLGELLIVCSTRGFWPIMTTLAPMANISDEQKTTLSHFNNFVQQLPIYVIDLWDAMLNDINELDVDYYDESPVIVSGSNKPHVLWSDCGRERILTVIKRSLNDIILTNEFIDINFE